MKSISNISGLVGLGFRKDFAAEFLETDELKPAFLEFAPENWMRMGGYWKKILRRATERYPVVCHGLSLSIGSPDELDWDFLKQLKVFIKENNVLLFSEHLSYAKCDNAHLYDLLPIPFRQDAIKHVVKRINQIQDFLEMQISIENVSYYSPVAAEITEIEFINQILTESKCGLLLDVNNVYVNSFNHKYDPYEFIKKLPIENITYIHMAGHLRVGDNLIIDTHGEPIIDKVYDLFNYTTKLSNPVPVLLERDFNIPQLADLQSELEAIEKFCKSNWDKKKLYA